MPAEIDMDAELEVVKAAIITMDPKGTRTAQVLRDTLDQLYDGQRTGRYRWDQLYKSEQLGCGNIVEINLHREFEFQDGSELDYKIEGIEVDCKHSQKKNGWMIPPEAHGHLCLLVWAEDSAEPTWSMGLVRVTADKLHSNGNRDSKTTLNESGRNAITWLFRQAPLPPNILLQLDRTTVNKIMSLKSGQKRLNELFRTALRMRVGRAVVATLVQQDDPMKRIRKNGGSRTRLQPEGIIILGQFTSHGNIARALGVPVPGFGESVSVRVTPASEPGVGVADIGGTYWRIAQPSDPIVPAPDLPQV